MSIALPRLSRPSALYRIASRTSRSFASAIHLPPSAATSRSDAGPSRPRMTRSPNRGPTSRRSATTLASTSSTTAPPPTLARGARLHVTPPSLEAIKADGFFEDDVQLIPPDQATMVVTPESVQQLERITAREPPDVLAKGLALRVGVESGGCHGYQYTMAITEERGVDDYVFQPEGVSCIPVVVDLVSLGLLKGSTLHHATELIGSSFRIQHNPQAKEGGACGCGVSWEANV